MVRGKEKLKNFALPLLWIGVIFFFSSLPPSFIRGRRISNVFLRFLLSDPLTHLTAYGVLGFLLNRSFRMYLPPGRRRRRMMKTTFFSLVLALVNELYQLAIPGRNFEPGDLAWDMVGVGIFNVLWFVFHRREQKILRGRG